MVSSRVHTQLMQIADERAQTAERKSLELEREVKKFEKVTLTKPYNVHIVHGLLPDFQCFIIIYQTVLFSMYMNRRIYGAF